ncbi:hypothetical protein BJ944DRAFT_234180 [Cunninghamella echinulata]|nr:hypothetical protein BJ944DRAFT_234180 [Cunninghamella echinulata]
MQIPYELDGTSGYTTPLLKEIVAETFFGMNKNNRIFLLNDEEEDTNVDNILKFSKNEADEYIVNSIKNYTGNVVKILKHHYLNHVEKHLFIDTKGNVYRGIYDTLTAHQYMEGDDKNSYIRLPTSFDSGRYGFSIAEAMIETFFEPMIRPYYIIHKNGVNNDNTLQNLLAYNYDQFVNYHQVKLNQLYPCKEFETINDIVDGRTFGNYLISSDGDVYSMTMGTILKPKEKGEYYWITLYPDLKFNEHHTDFLFKYVSIHSLVAHAFIKKRPIGMVIDHVNGNKKDNRVGNLEYVTSQENTRRCHVSDYGKDREPIPLPDAIQYDDEEEWIPLQRYRSVIFKNYEISTHGRIRKTDNKNIVNTYIGRKGYLSIVLQDKDDKEIIQRVHRIVAYTFSYDSYENGLVVDHINGIRHDNHHKNLRWVTQKENVQFAVGIRVTITDVYNMNNNETFGSIKDCCRATRINKHTITRGLSNGGGICLLESDYFSGKENGEIIIEITE